MNLDRARFSFEEWLEHCFKETRKPLQRYFPGEYLLTTYLIRLFENPEILVEAYDESEISEGLYYICSTESEYVKFVIDKGVPFNLQERFVDSVFCLYRELFSNTCSEYLSHCDIGPEPPRAMNRVCYMLWSLDCLETFAYHSSLEARVLEVLGKILRLNSLACQESALHGLGVLRSTHGERVEAIIDDFLSRGGDIHPALREYAIAARQGDVF